MPESKAIVRPEPGSPESLAKHNDWLYGDQPETCRCDHAWKPLGRLHGVDMGHGWVRMNTHPDCLHHSKCHGFTDTIRAKGPAWWGRHLYCPIHKTKNCPKRTTYRVRIPGDNGRSLPDSGRTVTPPKSDQNGSNDNPHESDGTPPEACTYCGDVWPCAGSQNASTGDPR